MVLLCYIAVFHIWSLEYLYARKINHRNYANLILCAFILLSNFLYSSPAKNTESTGSHKLLTKTLS